MQKINEIDAHLKGNTEILDEIDRELEDRPPSNFNS
jgi:hypothetical protein